ncbi:S8/S53 family peptidase [Aquimarina sp. RZ0]|uniref:S8/S53 family peptidase n=1 Tax=Aquimarina sp. RZ0 TaxID=2607730 RepID=UPI0011F0F35C|nr:S8/S53 family peptidase [Aquimarina sp. RZ0]KAA1247910.1 T9SS type A sorting domain-containing protein [Aquimarina sp. RZ0]
MKTKPYSFLLLLSFLCACWMSTAQRTLNKTKEKSLRAYGLENVNTTLLSKKDGNDNVLNSKLILKDQQIKIFARPNSDINLLYNELKSLGITKEKVHKSGVTGYIPIKSVSKLDNCKYLKVAMPLFRPKVTDQKDLQKRKNETPRTHKIVPQNSKTFNTGIISEAVQVLRVDNIRDKMPNLDGTGVRIGIISTEFNTNDLDLTSSISNGDLPGANNPNGYTQEVVVISDTKGSVSGITDQGRAMTELIHDIAPGAQLYFYGTEDYFDFTDGVQQLEAAGCDIIIDDLAFSEEPFFQDGLLTQSLDNFIANGGHHFTAAGNYFNDGYEASFNSGNFTFEGENVQAHQFSSNQFELGLEVNSFTSLVLQWDDPSIFAGSNNPTPKSDLDFYLLNENNEILAKSETVNATTGAPLEMMYFEESTTPGNRNTPPAPVAYKLVIIKRAGPDPSRIRLLDFGNGSITEDVAGITPANLVGHANGKNSIAVGTVNMFNTPFFEEKLALANYSAVGGVSITLDVNGNKIEPELRNKPDFCSIDQTSTSFYGLQFPGDDGFLFGGTSAAVTNLAGLAALALQQKPNLESDEMKSLLIKSTIDMDGFRTPDFDKGFDFETGYGFVEGDTFIANLSDIPSIYRVEVVNAQTNEGLFQINAGDTIDLANTGDGARLNIRALTSSNTESVRFKLFGSRYHSRIENIEPYAVFGDIDSNYNEWDAPIGSFKLIGQPFSDDKAKGISGEKEIIDFKIKYSGKISGYNVVSLQDPTKSFPLEEQLDLAAVDDFFTQNLDEEFDGRFSIQGNIPKTPNPFSPFFPEEVITNYFNPTPDIQVGNARFYLSGPEFNLNNDNAAPFSIFNDNSDSTEFWINPKLGTYRVFSILFARENDFRTRGTTNSFKFEVIDSRINNSNKENDIPNFQKEISVYPNPSKDQINVSTLKDIKSLAIYDYTGRRIYHKALKTKLKTNKQSIDISQLNSGLYVVKVVDRNDKDYSKKLIVKK